MITVAGALLALLMVGLSWLIIAQSAFPVFEYASGSDRFVNVTENIGAKDSVFMWTNRNLDLVAQAFVLFAAAAGCLTMLRITKGDEKSD